MVVDRNSCIHQTTLAMMRLKTTVSSHPLYCLTHLLCTDEPTTRAELEELKKESDEELVARLEKLSSSGDVAALYQLAELYDNGSQSLALDNNKEKAFTLFLKAADEGHEMAQYKVGWTYLTGFHTAVDYQKVAHTKQYNPAPCQH